MKSGERCSASLAKRLALLIPTFIGITIAAFAFIRLLPGDPIIVMAGERGVTPERHAELMKHFGFDRPLWEQYLDYLWKALQGDLGTSLITKTAGVFGVPHPLSRHPRALPAAR